MGFLVLVTTIYLIIGAVLASVVLIVGIVIEIFEGNLRKYCKNKIEEGCNKWLVLIAVILAVCILFAAIVVFWLLYMIDGAHGKGLLGNEREEEH